MFRHSNPLAGLKKGGVFIIQSDLGRAETSGHAFPRWPEGSSSRSEIRVFYLDAFKIAREEASDPELQLRMQGNAFQGAFFARFAVMKRTPDLSEETLFHAIETQLEAQVRRQGRAHGRRQHARSAARLRPR